MANATYFPAKELVHGFPTDAPMSILQIDGYILGANLNFAGDKWFRVAAYGMCTFSVTKPVSEPSVIIYAQAFLVIMFRW